MFSVPFGRRISREGEESEREEEAEAFQFSPGIGDGNTSGYLANATSVEKERKSERGKEQERQGREKSGKREEKRAPCCGRRLMGGRMRSPASARYTMHDARCTMHSSNGLTGTGPCAIVNRALIQCTPYIAVVTFPYIAVPVTSTFLSDFSSLLNSSQPFQYLLRATSRAFYFHGATSIFFSVARF